MQRRIKRVGYKNFNFSYKYHKLCYEIFPIIRGKSHIPTPTKLARVTINMHFFTYASILGQKIMPLVEISLAFLQWDFAPFEVTNHWEAMDFINGMRRFHLLKDVTDEVSVFILERRY